MVTILDNMVTILDNMVTIYDNMVTILDNIATILDNIVTMIRSGSPSSLIDFRPCNTSLVTGPQNRILQRVAKLSEKTLMEKVMSASGEQVLIHPDHLFGTSFSQSYCLILGDFTLFQNNECLFFLTRHDSCQCFPLCCKELFCEIEKYNFSQLQANIP